MTKQKISLFKLAKYTNLEIVMEAQVQSTGANQSRLMEKYKKNKNSIKNQAIALKVAYGFLLSFLIILPLFNYYQFIDYFAQGPEGTKAGLLAGSIIFAIFFAIQIGYILILGLLNISALMTGESFRWFETLPISEKRLNRLGFITVFRNIDIGLILLALSFPILMLILTQNLMLFLVSILVSIINVFFAFSVLVIIAERLSRIFRVQEINSRKSTLIRLFTMLGYFILVFSMSIFLNLAISLVDNLFFAVSSLQNIEQLNILFSLIPFPFSPSYLLVMSIEPASFSVQQWTFSIIGLILYVLITWYLSSKAVKSMRTVTSSSKIEIKSGKTEEIFDVQIETRSPIIAYIKKDLSIATKDIQMLMFIIMPIILPVVMIFSIIGPAGSEIADDFLILWTIVVIYFPIIVLMLIAGFLNVEDSGASILASLPLKPFDQMRAKVILMGAIQLISYLLPVFIMSFIPELSNFIGLFISWYPIVLLFLMIGFQMKVRLFGRMKYKYVLEEINAEHKTWKWIFIGTVLFLVCIAFLIIGVLIYSLFGIMQMMVALLSMSLGSLVILFITLNKMFPREFGIRKMIGIRATLRKYPILGTIVLLVIYFSFFYISDIALVPFILIIQSLPDLAVLTISFCSLFGFMTLLWFYIVPKGLKLPNNDKNLSGYFNSIYLRNKNHLLRNVAIGLIVTFLIFMNFAIFGNIFGAPEYNLGLILGEPGSAEALFGFGWFLFIFMLIPGIWEEVSFRGVITTLNERKYSRRSVLIFISILFGAFHLTNLIGAQLSAPFYPPWLPWWLPTVLQSFYASLLGLLFGYMVLRTNSLVPAIITHYLIDSVGQFFFLIDFNANLLSYILFSILAVGVFPALIGCFFTWYMTKPRLQKI